MRDVNFSCLSQKIFSSLYVKFFCVFIELCDFEWWSGIASPIFALKNRTMTTFMALSQA